MSGASWSAYAITSHDLQYRSNPDTDAHGLSDLGNRLAQLQDTMY
jgi:hypothetical protein